MPWHVQLRIRGSFFLLIMAGLLNYALVNGRQAMQIRYEVPYVLHCLLVALRGSLVH